MSELRNGAILNYATFENSKYMAKQTYVDIYTNILNFSAKYVTISDRLSCMRAYDSYMNTFLHHTQHIK